MNQEKLIIEMAKQIQELKLENERLARLAYCDELTGCYNRAKFNDFKENIKVSDYPLTIISVDCNGLKRINDTYGHLVGDEYIVTSAEILKSVFGGEHVYRTGGDEFVVAINATKEESLLLIEKVRKLSSEICLENGEEISLSIGAASSTSIIKKIDNLFATADMNMYEEKRIYHAAKEKRLVRVSA